MGGDDGERLGREAASTTMWQRLGINELDPPGGKGARFGKGTGFGEGDGDKQATAGVTKRRGVSE